MKLLITMLTAMMTMAIPMLMMSVKTMLTLMILTMCLWRRR